MQRDLRVEAIAVLGLASPFLLCIKGGGDNDFMSLTERMSHIVIPTERSERRDPQERTCSSWGISHFKMVQQIGQEILN